MLEIVLFTAVAVVTRVTLETEAGKQVSVCLVD